MPDTHWRDSEVPVSCVSQIYAPVHCHSQHIHAKMGPKPDESKREAIQAKKEWVNKIEVKSGKGCNLWDELGNFPAVAHSDKKQTSKWVIRGGQGRVGVLEFTDDATGKVVSKHLTPVQYDVFSIMLVHQGEEAFERFLALLKGKGFHDGKVGEDWPEMRKYCKAIQRGEYRTYAEQQALKTMLNADQKKKCDWPAVLKTVSRATDKLVIDAISLEITIIYC